MWKVKVKITNKTYQHHKFLIWLFRCLGFCPLRIQKTSSGIFLKISPFLLLLGFAYGAFSIFLAYYGVLLDITATKEGSIKITSKTDRFVLFNAITGYSVVFLCGTIINPAKFSQFFDYVGCLNQVDSIIKTTHTKWDKYANWLVLTVTFILNDLVAWIDQAAMYKISRDKFGYVEVLKRYGGLLIVGYMTSMVEFTSRILLNSLIVRIKRLNYLLELDYKLCRTYFGPDKKSTIVSVLECSHAEGINRLNIAYLGIMDAASILNNFLGLSTLVMIGSVLWFLIEAPYFLISVLAGERGRTRGIIELIPRIILLCLHLFRLLLLTETSYGGLVEYQNTKRLVCNLLCRSVDRKYHERVKTFVVTLKLRNLEFSACGVFTVDRFLFTTLISTITTFLVILLEYRVGETN